MRNGENTPVDNTDTDIKHRLETLENRVYEAADSVGRPRDSVKLVAVSKTHSFLTVQKAIDAGARIFGENYIQEAAEKIEKLSAHPISWHFIGHLQRNKAKYAVKLFDLIHSVDSLKLAEELDKRAANIGKIQNILIQVNISEEETKSGVSHDDALELMRRISKLNSVSVKGLMTMPPFFDEPEKARPYFVALRKLKERIEQESIPHISMEELSMGMSGDFEVAIQEGATLIRVGTAIFGKRH